MSPAGRLKVARQRDELFVRRVSGDVLAERAEKDCRQEAAASFCWLEG
jgi:hypothetical protein